MRLAPSSSEYSVWLWTWQNGLDMGVGVSPAIILTPSERAAPLQFALPRESYSAGTLPGPTQSISWTPLGRA